MVYGQAALRTPKGLQPGSGLGTYIMGLKIMGLKILTLGGS